MKIHVDAVEAAKAIKQVGSVIGVHPVAPVMSAVQLRVLNEGPDSELILRATNGSVDIMRTIPCGAEETGEVLLDGKKLAAMFATLPTGQTEIAYKAGQPSATIRTKSKAKFTMSVTNGEMPARPALGDECVQATMECEDLRNALETVRYAISADQTRMILTGVLLELYADKMNAVALDGYRLALSQKPCTMEDEDTRIVIPGESLAAILAALDGSKEVQMAADGKQLAVRTDYAAVTTGLLVGDFLDYRKIVPRDYKASIRFLTRDMMDALKRASAVGKVPLVKLSLEDTQAVIESNTSDAAFYEEVPCQHSGDDMKTAYNIKYFMECLSATNADELQLDLIDKTSAGVIRRTDGEKELHLLLPVRVVNNE